MNKSILKVVGVVAVAAALCVGCGGDNGVNGGGDNALYGTWCLDENCVLSRTFNRNGTFEFRAVGSNGVVGSSKGTYSTSGTTITHNVTEVCPMILDGCYSNEEQLKNAYIERLMSAGMNQEQARITAESEASHAFIGSTANYSVDGNTLTLGSQNYTRK